MAYVVVVVRRMREQQAYKPDLEDWLFHGLLPFAGYATLAIAALVMPSEGLMTPRGAPHQIGST